MSEVKVSCENVIGFTKIGLTQIFRNPSGPCERQSRSLVWVPRKLLFWGNGVCSLPKGAVFLAKCEKGRGGAWGGGEVPWGACAHGGC